MSIIPWIDGIGDLVSQVGRPEFGSRFHRLFADILGAEQCTVFAFPRAGAPSALIVEADSVELKQCASDLAAQYVAGEFEYDPNLAHQPWRTPLSVHCLHPDDLPDERYRTRFYDSPRITHELVLLSNQEDVLYCTSFYRMSGRKQFGAQDVERFTSLARFATQVLNRHWQLATTPALSPCVEHLDAGAHFSQEKRKDMLIHLKQVLLTQAHLLSPREAEICAGIVLGYTTLGLSLNLGISTNTVATHRKRAYQKLGVSSQNELFLRYHEFVNRLH